MKRIILMMWSMLLTFSLSACGSENDFQEEPETPIENPGSSMRIESKQLLHSTIGAKVLNAYLNNSTAANRLVVTLARNGSSDKFGSRLLRRHYPCPFVQGRRNTEWLERRGFSILGYRK